jgi:hypothetical protein
MFRIVWWDKRDKYKRETEGVSRYCCRTSAERQVAAWRILFPDNEYEIQDGANRPAVRLCADPR